MRIWIGYSLCSMIVVLGSFSLVAGSPPLLAQASDPGDIIIQRDVSLKTRDGVTLRGDIYRPNSPDKFPVILMRTPYDKSVGWAVAPAPRIVAAVTCSLFRMFADATGPKANGTLSAMNRPTG